MAAKAELIIKYLKSNNWDHVNIVSYPDQIVGYVCALNDGNGPTGNYTIHFDSNKQSYHGISEDVLRARLTDIIISKRYQFEMA